MANAKFWTIDNLLKRRAVVEKDIASYQGTPRDENGDRVSRNRFTGQRGITYIKSTERFRTFAHHPYYFYVGTFQDLAVAVQARDAAEAQAVQLLHKVMPELVDGAHNPKGLTVRMQKRGTKAIAVEMIVGETRYDAVFCDYNDILQWLAKQRAYL